ncbi:uncharacterized protein BDW43DRAFT_299890 [Aspergillus alliaceus]|uniref:uncharacterized protein n=1 Tax=Petromyces alliaceus TaxID=209559 RepID=UPI0012A75450|nr:uncharacterized protein BDW43DRAFT_299890 [Aspergillus alliaceus]KAB8233927.1 hypothetical protein BDW43DRAFT_299890 [Aspergillus alliaceus]
MEASIQEIEQPLEAELSNENLWMLIRRFNKIVYRVKAVEGPPSAELDLNRVEEEEIFPQKLWAATEPPHVSRLRSWRDPRLYSVAWFCDLLVHLITSVLDALILSPSIRSRLFYLSYPAHDAGSNSDASGGETTMYDSFTNAPETHKGESAEQEAMNLVDDIASVALESTSDEYGFTVKFDYPAALPELDPGGAAAITPDALLEAASATVRTLRILGAITDIHERFSSLLSPTSPFPAIAPRLQLVGVQVSIGLMFLIISHPLIVKDGSFIVSLAVFGYPCLPTHCCILEPSSHNEPLWPLCRKTPKSTSLAANDKQPVSPAPPKTLFKEEIKVARKRRWDKIFRYIGHTIAAVIKGHVTIDRAMSIAGSTNWALEPFGPLKFEAKFERKRSTVVIDSSQEQPMLYFTTSQPAKLDDLQLESQNKSIVPFQIPVTTIKELRKIEGLGWKGKLIVELMAGTKDSVNGLVISSAVQEQSYHLTGMHTYPWTHSLTRTR